MEFAKRSRSHLISIAGRLLVGFLVARYIYGQRLSEAARFDEPPMCTAGNLQNLLATDQQQQNEDGSAGDKADARSPNSELANRLMDQCTQEFLRSHSVDSLVKSTVDTWLGLDLSQAEPEKLTEAFERALSARPEANPEPEFKQRCNTMIQVYEEFRDTTAILADTMNSFAIQIDSNEAESNNEYLTSDGARLLQIFAQYGLFCSALLD